MKNEGVEKNSLEIDEFGQIHRSINVGEGNNSNTDILWAIVSICVLVIIGIVGALVGLG